MYLLFPLVFISGFCALTYQTAWFRLFRLIFGSSTPSTAVVLAIFMAGLGFGSLVYGKLADRSKSPLKLYAKLEIGISISAALSPFLISAINSVYISIGGTSPLGLGLGTVVKIFLSLVVLIIPTLLIGGTLPAIARTILQTKDDERRSLGCIYGINTLGAVLGAFITTFYFFEYIGIRNSIWLACFFNMLIAFLAYILSSKYFHKNIKTEFENSGSHPNQLTNNKKIVSNNFAIPAAAAVGFVFFLMELVWYRMLAPVLGGSSYTFGLILSIALLGIGTGGLLYGFGSKRTRPSLSLFAFTCTLEALFIIVPFAFGDNIAVFANSLIHSSTEFYSLVLAWSTVVALVIFIPSVIAGYQFPLLVALVGKGRKNIGKQVGQIYVFNTLGSIAGALAGGFGLLPILSAINAWRLSALLLVVLGLALIFKTNKPYIDYKRDAKVLIFTSITIFLMLFNGPSEFWRHSGIGVKRVDEFENKNDQIKTINDWRRLIIWQTDGIESSVALENEDGYNLLINGKSDGGARIDASTMVMLGIVPAILHENPKNSLIIGMGLGVTAGWLAQVDSIEEVSVVELEESVLYVADKSTAVNYNALLNPKINTVIGDGREFLITAPTKYDLIISEPSNPYRAGVASLFTKEFYESAQKKLNERGIFAQWLQAYEIDTDMVKISIATLKKIFPYVEIWHIGHSDLLFIASNDKVEHNLEKTGLKTSKYPFKNALEWTWGVKGVEGFYSAHIATDYISEQISKDFKNVIHTDDHPVLEFLFIRNLGIKKKEPVEDLVKLAKEKSKGVPVFKEGMINESKLKDYTVARYVAIDRIVDWPPREIEHNLRQRIKARSLFSRDRVDELCEEWLEQPMPPEIPMDLSIIAECMGREGNPELLKYTGELAEIQPSEAEMALAHYYFRRGKREKSAKHLINAFEISKTNPWANLYIMERSLDLALELAKNNSEFAKELFLTLGEPFAVHNLNQKRQTTRFEISLYTGDKNDCINALKPFEPYTIWKEEFLKNRLICYEIAESELSKKAREDIDLFNINNNTEKKVDKKPKKKM